jgi:hypothetical protein
MASYMIVPATARPSVPPRFLTKLCRVSVISWLYGNGGILSEGGYDGHVAAFDAGLDCDEGSE